MGRASGFTNCLNAGELTPEAWSRSDLQQHAHGCALARNFMPRIAGGIARRPGFWHAGPGHSIGSRSRLVPFVRAPDDALMIEFSANEAVLWNPDGTPLMDGPTRVTITHGLTQDEVTGLRWIQTGDVIVFTQANGGRTKRLKRLSNVSWVFGDFEFRQGPFRGENGDAAQTLAMVSADTNAGTTGVLTAAQPLFQPGHVGALFRLRLMAGASGAGSWKPGTAYLISQPVISNSRLYISPAAGTSGTTPPVHDRGTVSDGNMNWDYHDDGAGVVQITSVIDSTHANGLIRYSLPYQLGASPTDSWAEGAFSDFRGYPRAVPAIREERLVFGGGPSEPDLFDGSATAGFDADGGLFKPGLGYGEVVDDDAVRRFVGDAPGRLLWLVSAAYLMAGTTAVEAVIAGATIDDPISPSGCSVRAITDFGSADVPPVKAHDAILYAQRGARSLRDLKLAADTGTSSRDLSVLADHLLNSGIAELAWQGSENMLWVRTADNAMRAFVYQPAENVFGWWQIELGGAFAWGIESVAVLPGVARDTVWLVASRARPGGLQRLVLRGSARGEQMYYDAAEFYSGAAASGVAGLDHLEGEAVGLIANFAEFSDTVSGGEAHLAGDFLAPIIWAGLPYMSRFESLPPDLSGPGSTQAMRQKASDGVVVLTGVTAEVGSTTAARLDRVSIRDRDDTTSLGPGRRVYPVSFEGDTSREPRIVVQTDGGYDLQIHALRTFEAVNK